MTESYVDVVDEICAAAQETLGDGQWSCFISTLNAAGNKASVVYHSNMNPELTRRDFLKKFCLELESARDSLSNVAVEIRLKISEVTGNEHREERGCQECIGKHSISAPDAPSSCV